jgi:tight adherence protein B
MAALRAHQAGQPLLMALSGQQELTLLPEYRCLLQALWLHNETGASLSSLLADVVDRAEESLHLQRELAAKLGEARWTARVLEVVPVALYAYMQLTDPGALVPLREDAFGRQALWLGAGLWLLGMAVLARMQRPPHGSHTEV